MSHLSIRSYPIAMLASLLAAGPVAGSIRLESPTPGLAVRMEGPVTVAGTMPLALDDIPAGEYRLRIDGRGVPVAGSRLEVTRRGMLESRPLNGPGSLLLPPGVSFLETGRQSRGFFFLGAGGAALGLAVAGEIERREARSDSREAFDSYARAMTAEDALRHRLDALAAVDEEADDREVRNLWAGYLGAVWVGAAAEAWLLSPTPSVSRAGNGAFQLTVPGVSGGWAGMRSALVPGAGQRAMGHEGRGNLFFAGVGLFAAGAIFAQDAFLDARREQRDLQRRYDAAMSAEEAARLREDLGRAADTADDRSRLRWGFVALAAGVHIWNIVDATALGAREDQGLSWAPRIEPSDDGFRAGLMWRSR